MRTLGEIVQLSVKYLQDRQIDRARRMAEMLIGGTLGLKRIDLYLQFDRPMEQKEIDILRTHLMRLAKGEPVEYILGFVDFFNCRIEINRHVLIPRQESEILIDKIFKKLNELELVGKQAWDLCTGSGCLGIALKKTLPALEVALSDISSEALNVARKNSLDNGVVIEVLEGDLLAPFKGRKTDFLVCNPPYVTEAEYATLDRSVRDHEPKGALVGGLEFYTRLAHDLPAYLNPGAQVFFEIGATQGEAVLGLFQDPCWTAKQIEKDWAGHDRFIFLEFQSFPH